MGIVSSFYFSYFPFPCSHMLAEMASLGERWMRGVIWAAVERERERANWFLSVFGRDSRL